MKDIPCDLDEIMAAGPQATLEHQFIEEYLRGKGHQWHDVAAMPVEAAKLLMTEACRYAALKLAEIEARSKLRKKIEAPV